MVGEICTKPVVTVAKSATGGGRASFCTHGEWFAPADEVLEFIRANAVTPANPSILPAGPGA
jgi:hypothetical protein